MLCICNHGADKHYLDYCYGAGAWLGKCLEEDCSCERFQEVIATIWHTTSVIPTSQLIYPVTIRRG